MKKAIVLNNENRKTESLVIEDSDFIVSFDGASKPIKTDVGGKINQSLLPDQSAAESAKQVVSDVIYGEEISAMNLIYISADGKAYKATNNADYDSARVAGITLQYGNLGQTKPYLVFGRVDDAIFNFSGALDLFLGLNGNIISADPSATGALFYKSVGQSLKQGSIFLNISQTKIL